MLYRKHKLEKKRAYEQRIIEVEHASFTPIVLSASGGLAKGATILQDLPQCSQRNGTSPTVYNYRLAQMYHLLQSATVCGTMFTRCTFVEGKGSYNTPCRRCGCRIKPHTMLRNTIIIAYFFVPR